MADINEEARIPVYINDEQAKSALKTLTAKAEKWKLILHFTFFNFIIPYLTVKKAAFFSSSSHAQNPIVG